jgi:excisionase family DNA binding protein
MLPVWLSVNQVAERLGGVSTKLVYKMFNAGKLVGVKIEGTIRIKETAVTEYLANHSNETEKAQPSLAEPVKPMEKGTTRRKKQDHFRFFPPE